MSRRASGSSRAEAYAPAIPSPSSARPPAHRSPYQEFQRGGECRTGFAAALASTVTRFVEPLVSYSPYPESLGSSLSTVTLVCTIPWPPAWEALRERLPQISMSDGMGPAMPGPLPLRPRRVSQRIREQSLLPTVPSGTISGTACVQGAHADGVLAFLTLGVDGFGLWMRMNGANESMTFLSYPN